MGQIYVTSYMRNGSSVRAYSRTGKPGRVRSGYNKRSINKILTSRSMKKRARVKNIAQMGFITAQVRSLNEKMRANVFHVNQPRSRTARLRTAVQVKF